MKKTKHHLCFNLNHPKESSLINTSYTENKARASPGLLHICRHFFSKPVVFWENKCNLGKNSQFFFGWCKIFVATLLDMVPFAEALIIIIQNEWWTSSLSLNRKRDILTMSLFLIIFNQLCMKIPINFLCACLFSFIYKNFLNEQAHIFR